MAAAHIKWGQLKQGREGARRGRRAPQGTYLIVPGGVGEKFGVTIRAF